MSVALVLGLFGAFRGWRSASQSQPCTKAFPREPEFWVAMFVLATIYVTTFGLLARRGGGADRVRQRESLDARCGGG